MTRLEPVTVTCAICGREHKFNVMLSTNAFGPTDFDMRPPPMKRYTFGYEIQMCKGCSYANYDISDKPPFFKKSILKSPEYLSISNDAEIGDTAKAFMLSAIIHNNQKNYRSAGFLFLKAAWVFDDSRKPDMAIYARRKSYECLSGEIKRTKNTDLEVMMVDILRRTGDFIGASKIAHSLLERGVDGLKAAILRRELTLCFKGDTACHNTSEIELPTE